MNTDDLVPIEKDFVLRWFMYHMPFSQRQKLMTEHPAIYNKLVGDQIMHIHQYNTGECANCAKHG